ncbi:hypothetical protein L1987_14689 [Smallanthus sonchifolius]|uniref:Uncharacterized protein n=1 Tax=Smallanthus sonchifolius TaxID=185202 RepID=A0ACB9J701_9ASTR|nr:hypothetical protein L1987_14689 [Smallanthus sonchifolius]
MADDHASRCSNSSSGGGGGGGGRGGRSWKKLKHKKVPQRGMGVAQLEKIISEGQKKKDATVLTHNSSSNLVIIESNPSVRPPPINLMLQRSQRLQQPCSSSMVNVSAGTSSSSVLNFQMEPPSNQSYRGSSYHHLRPAEEKMVGMKRPYPFSFEIAPIPSFHCKFPSAYVSPISRSDESSSCSNGGTTSIEPAHPSFREHPSSSGAISGAITKKFMDENRVLTRDFLKLASPQASQSNSSSKENLYLSHCIGEESQFETLPPQKGQSEDPNRLSGRGRSSLPQFLGLFPAARTPMGRPGNSNGEAEESVDLNLKL